VVANATGQGHAIKIVGWGIEKGVKYWLCVNSWGTSWGETGLFRMVRGKEEGHVEDRVSSGLPRLDH